jgi:hypothetical protein
MDGSGPVRFPGNSKLEKYRRTAIGEKHGLFALVRPRTD